VSKLETRLTAAEDSGLLVDPRSEEVVDEVIGFEG